MSTRIGNLYRHILDNKKKPKDIGDCGKFNHGFAKFIDKLNEIKTILNAEGA